MPENNHFGGGGLSTSPPTGPWMSNCSNPTAAVMLGGWGLGIMFVVTIKKKLTNSHRQRPLYRGCCCQGQIPSPPSLLPRAAGVAEQILACVREQPRLVELLQHFRRDRQTPTAVALANVAGNRALRGRNADVSRPAVGRNRPRSEGLTAAAPRYETMVFWRARPSLS